MMNLPLEIIQLIFLELCSTETIFPLRDEPRLLVTCICSQWRAIALGMPDLWATLLIPMISPPPHDHIRAWISRSARCPLSVGFYGSIPPRASTVEIFNLIVPVIQRCASLKLCIDSPTLKQLLTLPPGSLCTLRSISIRPTRTKCAWVLRTIPHITAFQQCPQLRCASLELGRYVVDPAIYELPWHQLTHLSMRSCRECEMLGVLRQCTVLQECSISTFPAHPYNTSRIAALSLRPIVLPSLHTLHLNLIDPRGGSFQFVHALRLPSLRSLRLDSGAISWRPCPLLPLFQPHLSETVRNLDLSRWTTTDLPAALALVPNLEALKIRNSDAEVLRALGSGAVVPRLVALTLDVVKLGDLFDMLEARVAAARANSGIAVLTNVSAVDSGDGDVDTVRLEALRAAGMRLVFKSWSP